MVSSVQVWVKGLHGTEMWRRFPDETPVYALAAGVSKAMAQRGRLSPVSKKPEVGLIARSRSHPARTEQGQVAERLEGKPKARSRNAVPLPCRSASVSAWAWRIYALANMRCRPAASKAGCKGARVRKAKVSSLGR